MKTVLTRSPVVVRHPVTEQYVPLARGMEFDDNDPVAAAYPWAFEPDDTPAQVESVRIEQATKAPGERRRVGRKSE